MRCDNDRAPRDASPEAAKLGALRPFWLWLRRLSDDAWLWLWCRDVRREALVAPAAWLCRRRDPGALAA